MTFKDNQYEERGFLQKYGFPLGIGAVIMVVVALFAGQMLKGKKEAPRKAPEIVMIRPLPTPPAPPPPKPPEPPKETVDQMIKQDTVTEEDEKPSEAPAPASAGITTNNTGSGGVDMGLAAAGRGGNGSGTQLRGPRTQFGWFAAPLQKLLQGILSRNGATSKATFDYEVRLWADLSGRVTRVKIKGSSGDKTVDQAIVDEMNGLLLSPAPTADIKMPIVVRLRASRPN